MSHESDYYPAQAWAYGSYPSGHQTPAASRTGIVALVLGTLAHLCLIAGLSMGDPGIYLGATSILLAIIGTPTAIAGLVCRVRAKQSYGVLVGAVAVNVAFVALVVIAVAASTH